MKCDRRKGFVSYNGGFCNVKLDGFQFQVDCTRVYIARCYSRLLPPMVRVTCLSGGCIRQHAWGVTVAQSLEKKTICFFFTGLVILLLKIQQPFGKKAF